MKFIEGDSVSSTICKTIIGKVKKYINDHDFIMIISGKEMICNEKYYMKGA